MNSANFFLRTGKILSAFFLHVWIQAKVLCIFGQIKHAVLIFPFLLIRHTFHTGRHVQSVFPVRQPQFHDQSRHGHGQYQRINHYTKSDRQHKPRRIRTIKLHRIQISIDTCIWLFRCQYKLLIKIRLVITGQIQIFRPFIKIHPKFPVQNR